MRGVAKLGIAASYGSAGSAARAAAAAAAAAVRMDGGWAGV